MALTLLLIALAPLAAAIVILVQMVSSRPRLPPDAPREVRGWPLLGCLDFFRRRRDFLVWGSKLGPGRQFSFFYGPHPIVAVSGPEARASFFNSRELSLGAGFAGLYAASPNIEHLPEGNVAGNFMSLAKRLLHRDRLEAVLPTMVSDADTALATSDAILEPFALMLRLVYKLTHRTLGSNDIADNQDLLEETLAVFGKLDQSSALEIMFPRLFTPSKLRKMMAGLKLHRVFSAVVERRRVEGRKQMDAMQLLMEATNSNAQISAFIISALFAGLINSTFNAAWILVYLSTNPDWYARIRSEVDASIARHGLPDETPPKTLTRLSLSDWESDFPLVEVAMRETIRLIGRGVCMRKNFAKLEIIITTVTTFAHYDFHRCDKHGDDVSLPLPGLVRSSIGEKRPEHDVFLRCVSRGGC
ncbi:hypothetical protein CDD80_5078 [Ophiocordyceps camponoti-rufipedis]|uniref:Cytochrome P450 n=1 Tax=Ophiocordyceps camponoti-rufipedis TaxID=2004952 RepID=A0A2C5YVK8_9HYPO|nr:hypothetical protein CDD80_5078 [Ophiocordyceps camponoti-rufipedis]